MQNYKVSCSTKQVKLILDDINSVLNQTYENLEKTWGCSTMYLETACGYAKGFRIYTKNSK